MVGCDLRIKGRKILFVLNVVASGEKYSIVPCFYYFQSFISIIFNHLHTVQLSKHTLAIREPRDAGRLTQ